jgi:hypothetical protein
MVAVVAGNSLGLFNSSRNILGGGGALGDAANGRSGEQVYVKLGHGNLVIQDRDEYLAGLGIQTPLIRTYNSQGLLDDDTAKGRSGSVIGASAGRRTARNPRVLQAPRPAAAEWM